ncbi:ABC transporter substrate-binding protein [Nocardioides sp. LHD-245]|uniref:ABC transporter substrate-binding protein n=1 Tax=Nocardioides sp. LHD-245 TaxID=3051387 RepID=UPI0027DF3CAA|nr:ABC transporter substrate-binding protein [Nocardioides sp. LHD-245]
MMHHTARWKGARRRIAAAGLALGLALTVAACGGSDSSSGDGGTPTKGGELKVGLGTDVARLNPGSASPGSQAVLGAIYDYLMVVEHRGEEPKPNLATGMTPSDDFKTWTMTLPTGKKFSDGEPFNAEAVKFNFDQFKDPTTGSGLVSALSALESVEAPDETTVVFKLSEADATFPVLLANQEGVAAAYVASPKSLQEHTDDFNANAAGMGPYKIASWSQGGAEVVVEKNENYWDGADKVLLDKITFRKIEDPQSAYQAVRAGDVDVIYSIFSSVIKQAANDSSVKVTMGVGADQSSIVLNMTKPPFDDIRMRQAISMAIDREEITAIVKEGLTYESTSLFPPDDPWNGGAANPAYDPERAKELIAEYEAENGKVPFTYTCRPTVDDTTVVEQQLRKAGFDFKVEVQETTAALEAFFSGKYTATCWNMADFLDPGTLPYQFFHSGGANNTGGFENPEFDALVDQAKTTADLEERKKLWQQADEILVEELPWVWRTGQPVAFIYRPNVHSVALDEPDRLRGRVIDTRHMWVED